MVAYGKKFWDHVRLQDAQAVVEKWDVAKWLHLVHDVSPPSNVYKLKRYQHIAHRH